MQMLVLRGRGDLSFYMYTTAMNQRDLKQE
jgi:hypothetical protein